MLIASSWRQITVDAQQNVSAQCQFCLSDARLGIVQECAGYPDRLVPNSPALVCQEDLLKPAVFRFLDPGYKTAPLKTAQKAAYA